MASYEEMFGIATDGLKPFPWQIRFAVCEEGPDIVSVPTGLGKTAATVLGWLWRRRYAHSDIRKTTPKRLVYCLPLRTLVTQTHESVENWLSNLDLLGEPGQGKISVNTLLGGEINQTGSGNQGWDSYPEEDVILIGTQDMLLSRALNRGYAESRFRWPLQFGLLNNDCLWIMDEVQLMGAGLHTSVQLQVFRGSFGTILPVSTVWMSATLNPEWLETVDNNPDNSSVLSPDLEDFNFPVISSRYAAAKSLVHNESYSKDCSREAALLLEKHRAASLTLCVTNTVDRAVNIYKSLKKKKLDAELLLIHSRFRNPDKKRILHQLLSPIPPEGRIVVSTQVVEAGVDISARTLVTDVGPWASMVQRFGRCNRYAEQNDACIYWIAPSEITEKIAAPYTVEQILYSLNMLQTLSSASLSSLPKMDLPFEQKTILRKRDLLELFDTTPDLAGDDIDISRFIREVDERSVQVFWRDIDSEEIQEQTLPGRDELCRIPLAGLKKFLEKNRGYRWDHLDGNWVRIGRLFPGLVVMLDSNKGGYSSELGWTGKTGMAEPLLASGRRPEANDSDPYARISVQTITEHTNLVVDTLNTILESFPEIKSSCLIKAARWHDAGKAHNVFQKMFQGDDDQLGELLAKGNWKKSQYSRRGFRHELASAVAVLLNGGSDLIAYLVAAHHGKVRLSIRSLPVEIPPGGGIRFARGIYDGDILPEVNLGGEVTMPETVMDMSLMEIGGAGHTRSWLSRMLALRDEYGPFRLAFMEALVRISDWRASERGET